jgi:hypothetical protein
MLCRHCLFSSGCFAAVVVLVFLADALPSRLIAFAVSLHYWFPLYCTLVLRLVLWNFIRDRKIICESFVRCSFGTLIFFLMKYTPSCVQRKVENICKLKYEYLKRHSDRSKHICIKKNKRLNNTTYYRTFL